MKDKKLTPLFPPSITPVREGVYRVEFKDDTREFFSRWDGINWCCSDFTAHGASTETTVSGWCSTSSFLGWRGLAEKPGEL